MQTSQQKFQTLLQQLFRADAAESEIMARLTNHYNVLPALEVSFPPDKGGRGMTTLKKHLRPCTRRNTADFFIHKDLRGFLTRELDVYLKNEVVPLNAIILNTSIGGGG